MSQSAPIKPPFLRSAYNYDRDQASNDSALACKDKSLAQQHFKEECDINTIVDRFLKTGELPSDVRMPRYGDFTGIHDYKTAMDAITKAQSAFMEMPAQIRNRFHNDPQEFVAFCSDDANREEAAKMGLVPEEVAALVRPPAPPAGEQPEASKGAPTPHAETPAKPPKGKN